MLQIVQIFKTNQYCLSFERVWFSINSKNQAKITRTKMPLNNSNSSSTRSQSRSNSKRKTSILSNNKRRALLRTFACPFREEEICIHEQEPQKCRFGHPETAPDRDQSKLKDLPHFVCFHHLNGRCNLETSKVQNSNKLSCPSGLHLDLCEFAENPEQFEGQNRELIQNFLGPNFDLICCICFEKVHGKRYARNRRFGILKNCNHVFCATCLIKWHQDSNLCPVCRTKSRRYVVRAQFVQSPSEKMGIFPKENNSNSSDTDSDLDSKSKNSDSVPSSTISTAERSRVPVVNSNSVPSSTISTAERSRVPVVNSNSLSLFEQQNLQCQICLENVLGKLLVRKHQFAILQNCFHIFCSYCVIQLRSNPFRCPECQVESDYFAITQHWLGQGPQKRQLFHETLLSQGTYELWFSGHQAKVYSFDVGQCQGPNGLAGYLDDDWFHYVDQLRNRQRNVPAISAFPPLPTRPSSSSVSSTKPSFSQYASSIFPSTNLPKSTTSSAITNHDSFDDHHPSSYASFQSMPSSPYMPQSSFSTSSTEPRRFTKDQYCCIS